jgi:hypothetical protein
MDGPPLARDGNRAPSLDDRFHGGQGSYVAYQRPPLREQPPLPDGLRTEQGPQGGVVDSVDGRDRVELDAFVGGVQAGVGDAEAARGGDAESWLAWATGLPVCFLIAKLD